MQTNAHRKHELMIFLLLYVVVFSHSIVHFSLLMKNHTELTPDCKPISPARNRARLNSWPRRWMDGDTGRGDQCTVWLKTALMAGTFWHS